ncbi:transposase, partial [Cutibacterium acnes]
KHIEMNFSNMTGRKASVDHIPVTQFEVNDEQVIIACPAGQVPLRSSYNEEKQVYKATFDKSVCQSCPMLPTCPVQQQKKNNTVRFTQTKRQSDATRSKHGTERHRELSKFRAGVEGIVSAIRRRFDVDNLPVFGLLRSKMWISAKIGAFNFSSVVKYQMRMG